jgi:outer membrane protein TolC
LDNLKGHVLSPRDSHSKLWLRRPTLLGGALVLCILEPLCAFGQTTPLDPESIFARAVEVSPSVKSARGRLLEAQAKLGENVAQGRPQLSLNGAGSLSHGTQPAGQPSQTFSTWQGTMTLALPNPARTSATLAGARAQLTIAKVGVARARADIAFRSQDAYYGLLRAQDALVAAEQNQQQAELQLADTRKRIDAGDIPEADALRAQIPVAQSRAAVTRAQNALRVARQTLNSLLGQPLATEESVATTAPTSTFSLPRDEVARLALLNSPDVLEATANVDVARSALQLARRSGDPSVELSGSHTHTSDPTTYTNLSSLGLGVSIPLFDGGVARQQVRGAQAQLQQAESALILSRQQTTLAVEAAYADMESSLSDLASSQQVLAIAIQSSEKAHQAYLAGLTTTRDVLEAQRALAQARIDLNNAKYSCALAVARLRQLMGEQRP